MNPTRSDQVDGKRGASDAEVLTAVAKMLEARIPAMGGALDREQLRENRHLDEGTIERAYWHAGYVVALRDVLHMIAERPDEWPMKDEAGDRPDY